MAVLFWFTFFSIVYAYFFFPLLLIIASRLCPRIIIPPKDEVVPDISILVAVHNGEKHIVEKVENCTALDYPKSKLNIVIVSDGSTDKTVENVQSLLKNSSIQLVIVPEHRGKNYAINQGRKLCNGDIVIMTDVTAQISTGALFRILHWFSASEVGGVCSRKQLIVSNKGMEESQASYLSYDDLIKNCESRISSIAANEGYFYAVRKDLLNDIPDGVTDDSYTAMSVVRAGYRFLYDPKARASQPVRARSKSGEIARRRRIVSGSLMGINMMRSLLNPFKYPLYSVILFSHKVLRRLTPFLFIIMTFSTFMLIPQHTGFTVYASIQTIGFLLFLGLHYDIVVPERLPQLLGRPLSIWHYFFLGNWGTLRGVLDFFSGVRYVRWTSVNRD